jgi:hypothetical protein
MESITLIDPEPGILSVIAWLRQLSCKGAELIGISDESSAKNDLRHELYGVISKATP